MFTARRIITLFVVIPIAIIGFGVLFWYLAYGAEPSPPNEREVVGLENEVTISWLPEKIAHIDASDEEDFYRGIGYAHGVQRGWTAVLWRQTGLGSLGHWFDEAALPLDSLSRKIGFSSSAQIAYQNLPEQEQLLLKAYADGMNAALFNHEVKRSADFVLLDSDPPAWEPWHSLVVERLFAWLVAPEFDILPEIGTPAVVDSFQSANAKLRDWLQADGFQHSMAWAGSDTTGSTLYQRHITGGSALPLYHEILWSHDEGHVSGATLPGFPAFISGRSDTQAWSVLPRSGIAIQEEAYVSEDLTTRHERLETSVGNEYLVTIEEGNAGLVLEAPSPEFTVELDPPLDRDPIDDEQPEQEGVDEQIEEAPVDSTWFVQWNGFQAASDFSAWRTILDQGSPSFTLLTGDGLVMDSSGTWAVMGNPVFEETFSNAVLISQDPWGAFRTDHLQAVAEPQGRNYLPQLVDHDSSTWAAENASGFLASIDSIEVRLNQSFEAGDSPFAQALTYLRNWEFNYSESSISATIFDQWMREYQSGTGVSLLTLVDEEQPIFFEGYRRLSSLRQAVSDLTEEFDSDLEDWRWELTAQETRHFPTWSPEGLDIRSGGLLSRTRYAPINLPGRGHISSLSWGPTRTTETLPPPTSWEFWIRTANWNNPNVRRRYIDVHAILGRYRHREIRPDPVVLREPSNEHPRTTLTPAPN